MQIFQVDVKLKSYPVYVGANLLNNPALLTSHIVGQQVLIVTNNTIASLYLEKVKAACQKYQCDTIILPDGEQYKTLETLSQIFDILLAKYHTRKTTLIALGGGVIGDMAGFAAACYMRGVSFIQMPTTLLAQIDAAIGGKTAVNHRLGKNMIGAFYQPKCVIIDTASLLTLPGREFKAGLAEAIKYGLIDNANFFAWLEGNLSAVLSREASALEYMILQCGKIKAYFVTADEREAGIRALLNLGHTFGHAIENELGYGSWLHGEAVAVGILLAASLSSSLGWLSLTEQERIQNLIKRIGLPTSLPQKLSVDRLLELMAGDKKNIEGRLRLVLLKKIGKAVASDEVALDKVKETLENFNK